MAAEEVLARARGFGIGWWVALIVGLVAIILAAMDLMPKEQAMLLLAVCAIRL